MSDQARWILVAVAGVNAAALLFLLVEGFATLVRGRTVGRGRTRAGREPAPPADHLRDDDPLAALVAAAEQADGARIEGSRGENRLIEDIARWRLRAGGGALPDAADPRRSARGGARA